MNYYPDTYKDYKISFNKELAYYGNIVLQFLLDNNFFQHTDKIYNAMHVANLNIDYPTYKVRLKDTGIFIEDTVIEDIIINKIVRELNPELLPTRLKFEIFDPVPKFSNLNKKLFRYPYLASIKKDNSDGRYDGPSPSVVWHFDNLAYNNMVSITFLDEVTQQGGGTTISSEQLVAVYNKDRSLNEEETFRNVDNPAEIKGVQVVGPAGTIVTFNSHLLHSGGIPVDKSRKAMLIDFHSTNPNHFHPGITLN